MKKIVVTTDLSDQSKVAFPVAAKLAQTFGSEIVLLAVIEDPSQAALNYALEFPVFPNPDIREQLTNKIRTDLQKLSEANFATIKCGVSVREAKGAVHHEIIACAREHTADLIVIATHGRSGLKRMLIGSVAEKVVREAACPVLTVPGPRSN